ncbi:MAG: MMPL family transporter [Pseudomonadota bacterium]
MSRIGFGLERIGIVALARPVLSSILLLLVTVLSAVFIPGVTFNGNVTAVIPRTSENFLNFERQKSDFRNFSRDVAVIVRSPRLSSASGLEDLRNMQIEMSIAEGVATALSVFSMPDVDAQTGQLKQFFPSVIENDAEASKLLDRLVTEYPQARNLFSEEEEVALLLIALDLGAEDGGNDAHAVNAFTTMVEELEAITPQDFELLYAGLTPIGITILDTLIKDQVKLTLLGLLFGAVVAVVFFRCLASAILCAIPPILTAVWSIGLFGVAGVPITYLTTILPTLALILAYADGIVLHHRWQHLNRSNDLPAEVNLKEAVLRVGPASALTSITTAVAISSFALSSSEALTEFAWLGVILVMFAFLTVIIALPVVGVWLAKFSLLRTNVDVGGKVSFGRLAASLFASKPYLITGLSLVAIIPLFYTHFQLQPDYRITDYLPRNSGTLEAERIANQVFGGRSLVFLSVPVAEEGGLDSKRNRDRLGDVTELLTSEFDRSRVFSLHSMWRQFDESTKQRIALRLKDATPEMQRGYISRDGSRMLISIRVASSQSIAEGSIFLEELENLISPLEYSDEIIITGFPVLLATEFTSMINELRTSLLIAVFVGICLIGIATRSVFYALAAAIPNMFPILLMEAVIYFNGGSINVTEVVALTLAFGIAIDNAVHIINVFEAERGNGRGFSTSLQTAVTEVAPALAGSTIIICTATLAILTSILPILPIVGELIIAILIVALATNLVILPANILTLGRIFRKHA